MEMLETPLDPQLTKVAGQHCSITYNSQTKFFYFEMQEFVAEFCTWFCLKVNWFEIAH